MAEFKKIGLFSKIGSREDAVKVVKDTSIGFFVVAGLQVVLSFFVGFVVLIDAAIYVVGGFFLRHFNSRTAAVALLLLAGVSVGITFANKAGASLGGGNNIILSLIVLWMGIRAVEATFKLHTRFAAEPNANELSLGQKKIRAKLEKATTGDIILSLIIPGWGFLVGLIAVIKSELKRGLTMIALSGVTIAVFVAIKLSDSNSPPTAGSSPPPRSIENELLAVANEVTRSSPTMVDADTRLDGAVAGPGLRFTYLYTFPNIESSRVPTVAFDTNVVPTIKKTACDSTQLKPFFDNNVSVYYEYRGKDGVQIGVVEVNRITCGSK